LFVLAATVGVAISMGFTSGTPHRAVHRCRIGRVHLARLRSQTAAVAPHSRHRSRARRLPSRNPWAGATND